MAFMLSPQSERRLAGVHADLVAVVRKAIQITEIDFAVLEGRRSMERQRWLVEIGASWTYNSRHLTGHAVDLGAWVNGSIRWDWPLYYRIAEAMKRASYELSVPIEWGGDWHVDRKDGPHFELPWHRYPIEQPATDDQLEPDLDAA